MGQTNPQGVSITRDRLDAMYVVRRLSSGGDSDANALRMCRQRHRSCHRTCRRQRLAGTTARENVTQRTRDRLRVLVEKYRDGSGQPDLSTRQLARQMREAGVSITHQTLANILNGNSNPDPSTLRGLCGFFGVNQYYFDDIEPQTAELLGRVAKLDDSGHSAVARLLDELDELAAAPPPRSAPPEQGTER